MYNNWHWVDSSALDYVSWGKNEPDSHDTSQYCAKVRKDDGHWDDVLCTEKRGVVCKAKRCKFLLVSNYLINIQLRISIYQLRNSYF